MSQRKTYRSKWLLPDPWTVLENGYITMADGSIETIGTGRPPKDAPMVDLGSGAMMAPFVNAHTHLELSVLKEALPFDLGFRHWTEELIRRRAVLSEAVLLESAGKALEQLSDAGCGAVADISTLGITRGLLLDSSMGGIFFREHLGSTLPEDLKVEKADRMSSSLAAHAPHTTAPELFRAIRQATSTEGLPLSVHLAESEDELLFIQTARGHWADFLVDRGIDFSNWPLPAKSPVDYLCRMDMLDRSTLAVHLLDCSAADMELLRIRNVSICFCPRSNFLLHGKLPDIPGFLAHGFKPCLGTDSLASCPSLSILDEMSFVSDHYDNVSPANIIAMGTLYGAAALGLENRFGRLAPGFAGPPLYVPIEVDPPREVPRAVVSSGHTGILPDLEKSDHGKSEP